jgi:hypothetical protein
MNSYAQTACPPTQQWDRSTGYCLNAQGELIIALGVIHPDDAGRNYILEGDKRGVMELVLSPSLQETVENSVADSYEVEGYLSRSRSGVALFVTSLRPIE